ncbi:hypothetical protein WM40_09065 [Robbsia andropogonis]|uniref:ATP-grasp domain-containing protein n=1 Tax=Robbsia andropogonis TaxID=28092 RepID=A0A0F5K2P5_9BURK|nr:hypothetical protein [Robbsia andropogonis]KKB63822.1 hypothetical protein WM40_09065 [Robbsia andropogonis]
MPTVTILFGGRSVEWRASCQGYDHLREALRCAAPTDIVVNTVILIAPDGTIRMENPTSHDTLPVAAHLLRMGRTVSALECMSMLIDGGSIVFSLLQAQDGEDGTFQGLARFFDFPDNRSSTLTAALAFDLYAQAAVVQQVAGDLLMTVPTVLANIGEPDAAYQAARERFGATPVLLRPNAAGAGFQVRGLPFVTADETARFAAEISPYDDHFLVQQCVGGIPLSVGIVFRDGRWTMLPICAGADVRHNDGVRLAADGAHGAMARRVLRGPRQGGVSEDVSGNAGAKDSRGAPASVHGREPIVLRQEYVTEPRDSGAVAPAATAVPLSAAVMQRVDAAARRLARTFRDESYYQIDMIATGWDEVYFSAIATRPSLRRDGPFAWMLSAAGLTPVDLIRIEHANYAASRAFRHKRFARIAEWVAVHG